MSFVNFALYSHLISLISDNAKQFTPTELESFLANNGVKYKFIVLYQIVRYDQAERYVQTLKRVLKALG